MIARQDGAAPTITLALYAHVHACVAERLPLEEVLEHEGVTPERWAKAELHFRQRIAASPEAQAEYELALVEAEGKLGRKVSPVDRDVEAWLALLDAYGAAPAPFAFLHKLGLRQADIARLRRAWAKRIEAEPELEAKIAELRKGKLAPLPALEIGPAPFVSSRGAIRAERPGSGAAAEQAAAEIEGVGVDRLAALGAELARAAARDADAIRARYGLDRAQHEALLARFTEVFGRDPSLERDYRRLFAHHDQRLRAAAASRSAAAAPTASVRPEPPAFAAAGASRAPTAASVAPNPPPPADASQLARALGARLAAQGLSFRGTALAPESPQASTLPFAPSRFPAPPAPPPPPQDPKRPRVGSGTALALDPPRAAALPFGPQPAAEPSRERPALTVEQYASLCVELAGPPERRDEVLARYGLRAGDKSAVDANFERRFDASPPLRAEWQRACEAYRAWLAARRR